MSYYAVWYARATGEYLTSEYFPDEFYQSLSDVKKRIDKTTARMFGNNAKTIHYWYGGKRKSYKPPFKTVLVKVFEVVREPETKAEYQPRTRKNIVATKLWTGKRYLWR